MRYQYTFKLKKTALIVTLILALCLLCGCGGRDANAVIVAGSTSVQPYAEVLSEEYVLLFPGCEVDIQGGGSSAGITAAQSGAADIGMSSRELNENEGHLWSVEIAKDGLAVIVHPDNPIQNLSLEQIQSIYSGAVTNWSEIGGAEAKIHLISREEGSGTRSAFESLVMGTEQISPKAIIQDSNGAVRQLVSDDRNAIGFISLGLVDDSVKALRLDSVEATRENVINGSYTLYRPFLFVTSAEPAGLVKQFIDFTLSAEGQETLAHEGLIPAEPES